MSKRDFEIFDSLPAACLSVGVVPKDGAAGFTVTRTDARHGRGAGRILRFADGQGGMVFNWQTGAAAAFFNDAGKGKRLSRSEFRKMKEKAEAERVRYAQAERRRHGAAAELARRMLEEARRGRGFHPYLLRKRVAVFGAPFLELSGEGAQMLIDESDIRHEDGKRQSVLWLKGRLLLVPLMNEFGSVRSMQLIDEGGNKCFLKGGQKSGLFWKPENMDLNRAEEIGIAEGVATALSVWLLYRKPCVAAIDAGNLEPVAYALRRKYPQPFCIYADMDQSRTGELKAKQAARHVTDTRVVLPPFTEKLRDDFRQLTGSGDPTDFNDLLIAAKGIKKDE